MNPWISAVFPRRALRSEGERGRCIWHFRMFSGWDTIIIGAGVGGADSRRQAGEGWFACFGPGEELTSWRYRLCISTRLLSN
jgi:hypothetical protein